MNGENELVELTSARAMIYVPENAVEAELTFKVYQDGKLFDVSQKMDMKEIAEAVRKAEEGYIDEDDRFVLTDAGRAYVDEILRGQEAGWPYGTYEG